MKKSKKLLSIILASILVFASFVSVFADEEPELLGEWKAGSGSGDDITVSWTEGTLWFSGTGRMKDYDKLEDRPWNDCIGKITYVMLDEGIENIGKNAFAGLGNQLEDDWDTADCFIPESMTEIGEGAFADAKLYQMLEYRNPVKIGSKAYANTGKELEIRFDGEVCEIADDAFEGCGGTIFVVAGNDWDTSKQYGGSFSYKTMYEFSVRDFYDEEESGCMTMLVPEGESTDYFADCWMDGYGFDHYELVKGSISIDETNPQINAVLTDNVEINAYFKSGNENVERPEPETPPCPFKVTTADGQPAVDDIYGDYYWTYDSNAIIVMKSGLTISMADGLKSTEAYITSSFDSDAEITLDNVVVEGTDVFLSFTSNYPVKVNLVGTNKIIDKDGSWGYLLFTTQDVSFAGKGSLYLTSNTNNAAVCSDAVKLEDNLKIKGSKDGNVTSGLKDVEYIQGTTGFDGYTYYVAGTKDVCKTLLIKSDSLLQNPLTPIVIIVIIVAVALMVRRKKK